MKRVILTLGLIFLAGPLFAEFNVEAEVAKYVDTLQGEALEKSNAYFVGKQWISFWGVFVGCLIAALFMMTGLSSKMRNLSEKITKYKFLQDALYVLQYVLLSTLFSLPFDFYTSYIREHKYDLSNLDLAGWFMEAGKGVMVSSVLMALFIPLLFLVIRKYQKNWWLGGTFLSVVFLMFVSFIAPVFLAPVFNKYEPLPEGPLKQELLSMARSNGIPADNIYRFDASKQSKRISANVSGLFGTTRISLNDNLLHRTSNEEILAVMGHEMGHYVLNHVYEAVIYFGILILIGFYFVYWVLNNAFLERRKKWGIRSSTDTAYLPVLLASISIFFFLISPISNSIIRGNEVEADLFGLNIARQPDGFAATAMKLSEYRKISPGYWEEMIFHDHPSGENRVRMAMKWKKENLDSIPKLNFPQPRRLPVDGEDKKPEADQTTSSL